jgi:serine/threonine protein kinase/formylglycine-generating enzyme required for sulfatase activity
MATGPRVCYHQPVENRTAPPWPEAPMSEPAESFITRPESQGQPIPLAEQHLAGALPSHIGRYRVERLLGEGGFGRVYLAHDDELRRRVAIKVPHPHRITRPQDVEAYLAEARVLASLEHPNIVPVYDVGRTDDGLCFVVSKFIDGTDLSRRIKEGCPPFAESAVLVTAVAEALHHAHKRGLVHRDVKPANILLDPAGTPYLADFGLALKEEDFGKARRLAGTPAYMSPEQANGEGHRVDGRSDIFSLGVVLYELLTEQRPFRGDMPEVLLQIATQEPRPPRQIDDRIPKELERICLKALAKRAAERYTTARDLADDLRHLLEQSTDEEKLALRSAIPAAGVPASGPTATPVAGPPTPTSDQQPVRIVPKGLRAFDAHDADFFLELLPGPRDREGLPDSIRFWKTRIEETDADSTFAVGLLYGPSGCGKSSLVRAGLLPRLADQVVAVYVEATARETEARLLNGLRKRCPALPPDLTLKETLATLRRGQGPLAGRKVLLVLDQFEQWLHARREEENTELVQALRQCDGSRVQCLVLVRDDFWMAATRFMRELEIRLLEGQNSAAVDLFPVRHAEKVLAAFGRAFGSLPENSSALGKEQKAFLEQATRSLAREGKVICVRLALFAEMMKARAWTPAALAEVGGTAGVGVTFLEDTFSASTAPPEHRYHQKAARAVLKALLPEAGTDIKGHMRSQADLLAASGYAGRPKEFDDLLRILDSEVRLVTPTDPEGVSGEPGAPATGDGSEAPVADAPGSPRVDAPGSPGRYYQLTHDYLVPALRDWLTRKQKETRRGRAELLLADRAAVWNARPEKRQLPSLLQWLQIRWLTHKKQWTPPQRQMMRKATRHHLARALMAAAVVLLLGLAGREGYGRLKAQHLRDRLLEANTAEVPGVVQDMAPYRHWVNPLLQAAYAQAEADQDRRKQLHARLALAPVDPGQVEYLYDRLLEADAEEESAIRRALSPYKAELSERLWSILEKPDADLDQRFRAACALADYTPDDPRWPQVSGDVAARLVIQNAFTLGKWAEALQPVGNALLPPLASFPEDEKRGGAERAGIATLYKTLAEGQPDAFTRLEGVLAEQAKADASDEDKVALAKRQANVAVALVVMGRGDTIWPLLKHSSDPTRRSYLIDRLAPGGVDAKTLIARFDQEQEVSAKRALLLSLGEFGPDRLPAVERGNYLPRLRHIYREDPDPGLHAVAAWLLHEWHADADVQGIDKEPASRERQRPEGRRWYVNGQGQTMVIVPPGEFDMGEGRERKRVQIQRGFALAARDVTVAEFRRFRKEHQVYAQTEDCPVDAVSWYDAAAYCNWLSQQEGIPEDQGVYPKDIGLADVSVGPAHLLLETLGAQGLAPAGAPVGPLAVELAALGVMNSGAFTRVHSLRMPKDYRQRRGYRLPTEAEWEYACRAGSATGWSMGDGEDLLPKYAWFFANSLSRSHTVGSLRPNDWGLFDMHGNVWQWCQDGFGVGDKEPEEMVGNAGGGRVLRGGAWNNNAGSSRAAIRGWFAAGVRYSSVGFRVACSAPPRTR